MKISHNHEWSTRCPGCGNVIRGNVPPKGASVSVHCSCSKTVTLSADRFGIERYDIPVFRNIVDFAGVK